MTGKKILVVIIFTGLCIGIFRVGMTVGAASSQPGTVGDPLITQSYLEKRISEINGGGDTTAGFKKVTVLKGKKIIGSEGSEMILYSGSAVVTGTRGMLNLTSGELYKTGNSCSLYALYLTLSDDCGFQAGNDTTWYVKGSYSIK